MTLVGLPDFDRPLRTVNSPAWRAYGLDDWLSAASGLALAEKWQGAPHLMVGLFRPSGAGRKPEPFGRLDAVFRTLHDEAALLAAVRQADARGRVRRALPASGALTLIAATADDDMADLFDPIAVHPLAADQLRISRLLSPDSGSLLAGMIEDGTVPLSAGITLRYDGVSPRLPQTVVFNARDLMQVLSEHIEEGSISLSGLSVLIEGRLDALPIEIVGLESEGDKGRLAAALADRIAARFGNLDQSADGMIQLQNLETIHPTRISMDLSVPIRTARWINIQSDPFAPMRGDNAAERARHHVSRTTMQPLSTGGHRVRAFANVPMPMEGMERMGVVLRAAPNPPSRPHAISTTLMFDANGLEQSADIFLSPGEDFAVTAHGFSIVADEAGVRRISGPPKPVPDQGSLWLNPEDFGFTSATIEADQGLLLRAEIEATICYRSGGRYSVRVIRLDLGRPSLSICMPADASEATMKLTAVQAGGARRIELGEGPLQSTFLDLTAVPDYGSHEISIHCPMGEEDTLVAIDIVKADAKFDPEGVQTLSFTADRPRRTWRYFAGDPFLTGFCWRYHKSDQLLDEGWVDSGVVELLTILPSQAPETALQSREMAGKMAETTAETKTVSLAIDFGNGVTKTYRNIAIGAEADVHDVLAQAQQWEPPLSCKIETLFTDRGGTNRNFLASVDGVEGQARGDLVWKVEANGEPIDLNRPSIWATSGNRLAVSKPVDAGAELLLTLHGGPL